MNDGILGEWKESPVTAEAIRYLDERINVARSEVVALARESDDARVRAPAVMLFELEQLRRRMAEGRFK